MRTDDDMKRLLRNRAPLLKKRGVVAAADEDHAMQEQAMEEFWSRPACIEHAAPEIEALLNNAFKDRSTQKPRKSRKDDDGQQDLATPGGEGGPSFHDDAHDDDGGGYDDYGPAGDDFDAGSPFSPDLLDGNNIDAEEMDLKSPESAYEIEEAIISHDGFTNRTRSVMKHLKSRLEPSSGSKRRHEGSTSSPSLNLSDIVDGKSRLEACRWFFESLVLRNKGFVDLAQDQPYGDISILPSDKMMSHST